MTTPRLFSLDLPHCNQAAVHWPVAAAAVAATAAVLGGQLRSPSVPAASALSPPPSAAPRFPMTPSPPVPHAPCVPRPHTVARAQGLRLHRQNSNLAPPLPSLHIHVRHLCDCQRRSRAAAVPSAQLCGHVDTAVSTRRPQTNHPRCGSAHTMCKTRRTGRGHLPQQHPSPATVCV